MRNLLSIFLFLYFGYILYGQKQSQSENRNFSGYFKKRFYNTCKLPISLSETSGLIYFNNCLWTINDGGNKPVLYGFTSENPSFVREIFIQNVQNEDWEALTQDSLYIYIGNFGNNLGYRKNYSILKVKKENINNDSVFAEFINFMYNEQPQDFSINKHHFDCEAMVCFRDSLYIFSKNWDNRKTYVYGMPVRPGNYSLNIIDSFNSRGLITDADYNPNTGMLVLSGYKYKKNCLRPFLLVFFQFTGSKFFSGGYQRLNLCKPYRQIESITSTSPEHYILTNEMIRFGKIKISSRIYQILIRPRKSDYR